jgi:hypothetical protein
MESASTGLDRNSTGSTRLDRQGLDSPSTTASTAARRSLDSSTARQPQGSTTAASRETVSWRTAACQPPGVIQELRWPHGGHGDCASARAGYAYGVRRCTVGPRRRPRGGWGRGARGGGAICCVAAPAEALSHWDDRLADTRTDRRTRIRPTLRSSRGGDGRNLIQ